jgi:threonine synthase
VSVSDEEITAAQRALAKEGVGVEPASAASVAGLKKLRDRGDVDADERVVCLTTGHLLKDPDAAFEAGNEPEPVANDTDAVLERISQPPGASRSRLRRLLPF